MQYKPFVEPLFKFSKRCGGALFFYLEFSITLKTETVFEATLLNTFMCAYRIGMIRDLFFPDKAPALYARGAFE